MARLMHIRKGAESRAWTSSVQRRSGAWVLVVALTLSVGPSPGCKGAAPTGRLVPVGELAEQDMSLLAAYGAGGLEWERARERALTNPAQARFLVDNIAREMVLAWERVDGIGMADPNSPNARAFKRAQEELVEMRSASTPLLVGMIESGDGVLAFLGKETLLRIGAEAIPATLPLLTADEDLARQRAAELLAEIGPAEAGVEGAVQAQLLEALDADRSWMVRAQVAKALGARAAYVSDREDLAIALQAATTDADLAVAGEAARALAMADDPRAFLAVVALLDRSQGAETGYGSRAAQEALLRLSGSTRARSAKQWREWWRENGPSVLERFNSQAAPR